jgi:glucosamine-6-phosphate isomerase
MEIKIFDNYDELSAAAADAVIETILHRSNALLCFATGNSPLGTYKALAEKIKQQRVDLSKCFCIGLDEWLGVSPQVKGSCHYDLHHHVFQPLGIQASQVHLFDGLTTAINDECEKMNELIEAKGGVDCMIVGIGLNGHIGFNEPGVSVQLRAHVQELHEATLLSGQTYFTEAVEIKNGITLGLAQVMNARKVLLLANGKSKAAIIKAATTGEITEQVPASCLQLHKNAMVMIDAAAAGLIN